MEREEFFKTQDLSITIYLFMIRENFFKIDSHYADTFLLPVLRHFCSFLQN